MKYDCGSSITFRIPGSTTATNAAVVVLVINILFLILLLLMVIVNDKLKLLNATLTNTSKDI